MRSQFSERRILTSCHDRDRVSCRKKLKNTIGLRTVREGCEVSRFPLHGFINTLVPSHPETVRDISFIRRLAIYDPRFSVRRNRTDRSHENRASQKISHFLMIFKKFIFVSTAALT